MVGAVVLDRKAERGGGGGKCVEQNCLEWKIKGAVEVERGSEKNNKKISAF